MVDTAIKGIEATRGCYCLAARKRARELTREYEKVLRPHGLRATQFSVLAALTQTGPLPVSKLADILGLERTTLTRVANVMGKHKWLKVTGSAKDGRVQTLAIASTGKKKLAVAFPDWKRVQDQVSKELSK